MWLRIISFVFLVMSCTSAVATVEPPVTIDPKDRCSQWIQPVRTEHTKYFGFQFPYWYGVGQLRAESACRADVGSFDGGQGVAQFMPKTAQYIASLMGEALDPYNPKQAIRAQAFYMNRIHILENWGIKLWIDYQIYNGGRGTLYNEYKRAGYTDWEAMKQECQRKKIEFSWGILDLCVVNYDYSKKVASYGEAYRRGSDGMMFW
uniref:Putative transglycosylase n=2 Tax=viral metagenome TaxID=1070528 RepID=A0A6M3JE46_9ZZZZ